MTCIEPISDHSLGGQEGVRFVGTTYRVGSGKQKALVASEVLVSHFINLVTAKKLSPRLQRSGPLSMSPSGYITNLQTRSNMVEESAAERLSRKRNSHYSSVWMRSASRSGTQYNTSTRTLNSYSSSSRSQVPPVSYPRLLHIFQPSLGPGSLVP